MGVLLNCNDTHYLKVLFLLLAISLSYPDSYMADKNFQATKPNSAIYRIFLAVLFYNSHCLMNTAILRREHMIFLASPAKNSSIPNKEVEQKLLSHNCGSIG